MEKKCPICGTVLENNICSGCGYKEEADRSVQPAQPVPPVQPYQPAASGQEQQTYSQPKIIINNTVAGSAPFPADSPKSRTAALILCIFLGYLGIHRFYVGKIGTGLLYLFTGGLCGLGWLIDTILVLFGGFRDQYGMPVKKW